MTVTIWSRLSHHDTGIGPAQLRPQGVPADPTKQPAANKLAQDFTADAPNRKSVTDITYLPMAEGWVYLAAVMTCSVAKSAAGR